MNYSKSILALALACFVFVSCKKENNTNMVAKKTVVVSNLPKAPIAPENLQTANFTITGMTCAVGCAKTIEENLSSLDGVQTAKVDFDKKTAIVTFDKTTQSTEKLTKVVQATGNGKTYTVSNMKS